MNFNLIVAQLVDVQPHGFFRVLAFLAPIIPIAGALIVVAIRVSNDPASRKPPGPAPTEAPKNLSGRQARRK